MSLSPSIVSPLTIKLIVITQGILIKDGKSRKKAEMRANSTDNRSGRESLLEIDNLGPFSLQIGCIKIHC